MQRNTTRREEQSSKFTIADLCKAIEKRRVAYRRDGHAYVVRTADVLRLRAQPDNQPDLSRKCQTLEMGCSA